MKDYMLNKRHVQLQPLVSIVVPIYNSEKFLPRCLSSICKQTYDNIEIILVDDGSTDDSLRITQEFAKKDSRIMVITQKNGGPTVSRKNGIKTAKGSYIITEDSDDWLDRRLVEKCIKAINEEKNVDVVKFGYINEPSKIEKNALNDGQIKKRVLEGEEINQVIKCLIYDTSCNHVWNEMVKKELYDFGDELFKTLIKKGEDAQTNLQVFQKAKKVVFLEDNLYHYTDNPDGATNSIIPGDVIHNVKDNIYLNKIREKVANDRFGSVNKTSLINTTLSMLSGKIIRILASSKNPEADLLEIENGLGDELSHYLLGFDKTKLNHSSLKKMICVNIINGDYEKNIKYRPFCKLLKRIGKVK